MVLGADLLNRVVDTLVSGGIVAFPTETVYGVGALAGNAAGVERIFELKGRPRTRALIVHLHAASALQSYATDVPAYAQTLAQTFWPGALTLVFRRQPEVIDAVTGGGDTVGVRVPDHPVALEMLNELHRGADGAPAGVAAPSANRFGEPPATTAAEVAANLGAAGSKGGPDIILDGGVCPTRVPSTILSCVGDSPRLLRRGAVELSAIEDAIGLYVDQ